MAEFIGKDTKYFVARTKESSNEGSLIRTNTFTGLPSGVNEFGQADAHETFDVAKSMKDWLNNAPAFVKGDYDYYVIQKDEDSFRLDENGDKVETLPEATEPAE